MLLLQVETPFPIQIIIAMAERFPASDDPDASDPGDDDQVI